MVFGRENSPILIYPYHSIGSSDGHDIGDCVDLSYFGAYRMSMLVVIF